MKTYRLTLLFILSLFFTSCGNIPVRWVTTEEGAKVWYPAKNEIPVNWNGSISDEGYAEGYGTLQDKTPINGSGNQRFLTGNMKKGKFQNKVAFTMTGDYGGSYTSQYSDGKHLSSVTRATEQSAVASSSGNGLDSNTLLGGMLALAGASQGDDFMVNSGVALAQDDLAGLMRARQQTNGASGITNQTNSNAPRKKVISANKRNLIDKYKLRVKYQNHVQYSSHVKAADANYRMYKKTGEERYYKAHESSADILNRWRDIDNGKY